MKKRYLKKWVEYSIIFIQFILIMILSADSDNLNVFIISKIIALLIFYINHLILIFFPIYCVTILFSGFTSNIYRTNKKIHSKGFINIYVISA